MRKRVIYVSAVAVVTLFSVACKLFTGEEPVAQVGDAVLTRTELDLFVDQIGTEEEYLNAQRRFVNNWVDTELLYQEALRQNTRLSPSQEAELERVRKNMIVTLFLKNQVDNILSVADDKVIHYYENHAQEFLAQTNYFRFEAIKTAEAQFARSLESELKRGTDIVNIYNSAPYKCYIVSNGKDYLPETSINSLVAAGLHRQRGNDSFSRYSINGETYFIRVLDVLPAGSKKPLAMVSPEIRQRLLHEDRQSKHQELVVRLRKNYPFEINLPYQTNPENPR